MNKSIPTLPTVAKRLDTYVVSVSFYNEDGDAVTPNTVTWSLKDAEGDVVNSRTAESETPDTSVDIVLTGNDLACPEEGEKEIFLKIAAPYDSARGSGLASNQRYRVVVRDI